MDGPNGGRGSRQDELAAVDARLAEHEASARWHDVSESLAAKADLVEDPAERAELLARAGTIWMDRLAHRSRAIECFEAALRV